jgi:hypothetical protein
VRKVIPVHLIERVIQSEVCTENLHQHDVDQRTRRSNSIHDELRLDPWILGGSVALRVYPDVARDIESVANKHSVAETAEAHARRYVRHLQNGVGQYPRKLGSPRGQGGRHW